MLVTDHKPKSVFWLVFLIIMVLFVVGLYLGLRFGAVSYSHAELLSVLADPFTSTSVQDVVIDIRIPRMVGAILVGAAFAVSGALMQGVTRNAIADPGLLGINAGAGLALVLGYAILGKMHYSLILLVCMLGAILAAFLVFALSYQPRKGYNQLRLILSGAMVATLFTALGQAITIYFDLSQTIVGWQAGGLIAVNWSMIRFIAPFILIGLLLAQCFSHQLTILSLDETVAKSLGQKTRTMTIFFLGLVMVLAAAAVALVGTLAFVGLIIPHFIRSWIGKDYRQSLPLMMLGGATFMLWVDVACRCINPPYETPLSAIVSIVGLPCFLWLLKRGRPL